MLGYVFFFPFGTIQLHLVCQSAPSCVLTLRFVRHLEQVGALRHLVFMDIYRHPASYTLLLHLIKTSLSFCLSHVYYVYNYHITRCKFGIHLSYHAAQAGGLLRA